MNVSLSVIRRRVVRRPSSAAFGWNCADRLRAHRHCASRIQFGTHTRARARVRDAQHRLIAGQDTSGAAQRTADDAAIIIAHARRTGRAQARPCGSKRRRETARKAATNPSQLAIHLRRVAPNRNATQRNAMTTRSNGEDVTDADLKNNAINNRNAPSSAPSILVTVGSTTFPTLIRYILSSEFTRCLPSGTTLNVQYGRSDLAEILTTTELSSAVGNDSNDDDDMIAAGVSLDANSAKVPQPGLRNDPQHGLTWRGVHTRAMDPGVTGSVLGWRVGRARHPARGGDTGGFTFEASPSQLTFHLPEPRNVTLTLFDFKPDLRDLMHASDIVISHAGSGSLLECLRSAKGAPGTTSCPSDTSSSPFPSPPPLLILVPNTTLMDNHQMELAVAVDKGGWAWKAAVCSGGERDGTGLADVMARVVQVWRKRQTSGSGQVVGDGSTRGSSRGASRPTPFPPSQPQRFRGIVEDMLGVV